MFQVAYPIFQRHKPSFFSWIPDSPVFLSASSSFSWGTPFSCALKIFLKNIQPSWIPLPSGLPLKEPCQPFFQTDWGMLSQSSQWLLYCQKNGVLTLVFYAFASTFPPLCYSNTEDKLIQPLTQRNFSYFNAHRMIKKSFSKRDWAKGEFLKRKHNLCYLNTGKKQR